VDEAPVTALIAAGAAIGGGALTEVFTLAAAKRQAAAAWAAGERQAAAAWEAGRQQAAAAWDAGQLQATAQLDDTRRTLTEQTLANRRAVRRAGGRPAHPRAAERAPRDDHRAGHAGR
jgi:hypothetical protein